MCIGLIFIYYLDKS